MVSSMYWPIGVLQMVQRLSFGILNNCMSGCQARSASGRALWSPNTAVVKPLKVVQTLQQELQDHGVSFKCADSGWLADPDRRQIRLAKGETISYGHLINCAGLQADRVAHSFGVGLDYTLLPFKGMYWQLKPDCPIQPRSNLYPVPDLNVPFLGVHFTPSADETPLVSIGPTATPAWGRENYRGVDGCEPVMATRNLAILARQYLANNGGFRRYVHEQAFLALPPYYYEPLSSLSHQLGLSTLS